MQAYHDPQDEPTAEPLDPSFFDFDMGEPLGKEQLKGTCACTTGWRRRLTALRSAHIRRGDAAANAVRSQVIYLMLLRIYEPRHMYHNH